MKRFVRSSIVAAALAVPFVAFAAAGPAGGLAATAHDFTASPTMTAAAGGAIGLCTYCHTPHQAITTSLLWNHKATANTFGWDAARMEQLTLGALRVAFYPERQALIDDYRTAFLQLRQQSNGSLIS